MPFYRSPDGQDWFHLNVGRKPGPRSCVAPRLAGDNPAIGKRCARMALYLCDYPAGQDLAGQPLTCDAPMCEQHRTRVSPGVDHCPRHAGKNS